MASSKESFDNCLCNFLQAKVSCYAFKCTFFRDTICLLTDRKMIKIVTLIDVHIVLTYDCWHCFLVFNIWVSRALEMTIHFYYPTLELFCFSFTQPFTHSRLCLPNPFLFGTTWPSAIPNDRSLSFIVYIQTVPIWLLKIKPIFIVYKSRWYLL
jgi:hypothetical protein